MKKVLTIIIVTFAVTLLPWLVMMKLSSSPGIGLLWGLLMFYIVDPAYSAAMGIYAGEEIRDRWYIPLLTSALIMTGFFIIFDREQGDFIIFALAYLAIGVIFMLASVLINKKLSSMWQIKHEIK